MSILILSILDDTVYINIIRAMIKMIKATTKTINDFIISLIQKQMSLKLEDISIKKTTTVLNNTQ